MNPRLLPAYFACLIYFTFIVEGTRREGLTVEADGDVEADPICGLHPVDILTSSILQNSINSDSSSFLIIGNALTSLYRTQPEYYAFLMRCTTAWNRCQKAKLSRRGALTLMAQDQPWKRLCKEGLSLPSLQQAETV
ncbi:unnamed protein product [Hymenolepis diminuta]|uniref:Secreted protein n=1 Tax=Hymenolepis diminuta TaxID=6216 RepID=A0A0R3SWB1_HYMDI|nr:unnamed protein product [Hymenolepis diminuta]VUZ51972.1 unnamed protein product [Hymenolepis diminuta]